MTNERLATWADFAAAAPKVAAAGAGLPDRSEGAALLATVRGDAPPRIHPVTVGVVGDGLYTFLLHSSKRRVLLEDARFALHAAQDQAKPDEFSIRGWATLVQAGDDRDRVASGWFFESTTRTGCLSCASSPRSWASAPLTSGRRATRAGPPPNPGIES